MEKLLSIKEVFDVDKASFGVAVGEHCHNGIISILNALSGDTKYDGYEIKTSEKSYFVLIENERCCCEQWGYFASEDDFENYIGEEIISVELTNTALNNIKVKETYADDDQIQFVDFRFSDGSVLQFAVYNAHNGYYGHSILILSGENIICQSCL